MYVNTMKVNDVVYITSGNITIKVMLVDIRDGEVRIGIEAPKEFKVVRMEKKE